MRVSLVLGSASAPWLIVSKAAATAADNICFILSPYLSAGMACGR